MVIKAKDSGFDSRTGHIFAHMEKLLLIVMVTYKESPIFLIHIHNTKVAIKNKFNGKGTIIVNGTALFCGFKIASNFFT